MSIDRPWCVYLCLPCKQTDARGGQNDEDETRKARDTLMTRLRPRIEHCAPESIAKRTNATPLALAAYLRLGIRVSTRRKMGGKVGLICGSCWSGKYSMYIYIYNYTLFPHFLSILRLISFFNYFYSMMELLLLLHLRAPSSYIHERINIYNEYNEFVRSKNKRRVFHKAILLSRILFNTVYIPNRIVFLT